jgi:hypothetical protein
MGNVLTQRVIVSVGLALGVGCSSESIDSQRGELAVADGFTSPSVGPTGRWRGQSEFISAAPFYNIWGPLLKTADALTASRESQVAEAPREVSESDIYRLEGGILYNLNFARGLQTIDVANPDQPRLLGRAPILGTPHEMYVEGGMAFVLLNDYFEMSQMGDSRGPALFTVDARDPSQPRGRRSVMLKGYLTDSRKVGHVIYVVTNEWRQVQGSKLWESATTISSISVANAARPRLVASRELVGSSYVMHATDEYLFVASSQYPNSEIQAIDIRDPNGAMTLGGRLAVPGYVWNKFQLHADKGVLRVVTHQWQNGGTAWVTTVGVNPDRSLRQLGSLELPGIGTLSATRNDGDRVYLVHAQWIDPLDVIDVTNPEKPTLLSRLEFPEIVSQLVIAGDRAMGLGRSGSGLAVLLFDLSDPHRTSVLSSVPVGETNWSWSSALWDDRAFTYFAEQNLLVVPFQSWSSDRMVSAAQLVDVDLAAGTLAQRGRIAGAGDLRRANSVKDRILSLAERSLKVADITDRDNPKVTAELELTRDVHKFAIAGDIGLQYINLATWSTQANAELRAVSLSGYDAEKSEALSRIDTGLPVGDLFVSGRNVYIVARTWEKGTSKLVVKGYAYEAAIPRDLGTLEVLDGGAGGYDYGGYPRSQTQQIVQVRPDLLAISTTLETGPALHIISLSGQAAPVLVATQPVSAAGTFLDLQAWGGVLYVTDYEIQSTYDEKLVEGASLDLMASKMIAPFWIRRDLAKYYVTLLSFDAKGSPTVSARINVPGRPVHAAAAEETVIFTLDQRWLLDQNEPEQHKHLVSLRLDLAAGTATLLDMTDVPEGVDFVKVVAGYAHYVDSGSWTGPIYTKGRREEGASETFKLHIKDVRNPRNLRTASVTTLPRDGYGSLADVTETRAGRTAVISLGWGGVAFYDVSHASSPDFEGFVRTPGWWSNQVTVDPATAHLYLAAGDYGVYGLNVSRE